MVTGAHPTPPSIRTHIYIGNARAGKCAATEVAAPYGRKECTIFGAVKGQIGSPDFEIGSPDFVCAVFGAVLGQDQEDNDCDEDETRNELQDGEELRLTHKDRAKDVRNQNHWNIINKNKQTKDQSKEHDAE